MSRPPVKLPPLEPSAVQMDSSALRGFERLAVPLCAWLNTSPLPKRAVQAYVSAISRKGVVHATRPNWELHGLEHVVDLDPPHAVVLVSNHRSFFDMYITSAVLYERARFVRRLFFPVRSEFFYDSPAGLAINLAMSGCAMWPPVFRDDRRELNPIGLEQMLQVLDGPGAVLGIHPEGRRGKGDDPYALLPARPGVGRLVASCHPSVLVLPFFVLGLSNDIGHEIRRARRPEGQRGEKIRITFGAPARAGELATIGDDLEIARHVLDVVAGLGREDRRRQMA